MNLFARPVAPTLLLMTLLTGCGGGSAGKPGGPGAGMPPPEVDVITAGRGAAKLTQDLPGRLEAYRTAQVRARVEGVIEKRLFAEGSDVKAGALLYQISAQTNKAAAAAAAADLAIARQTMARYKLLLPVKAVSQQEYDLAEARVKQAEAVVARTAEDLENSNVPAAISGHIGRTLVTEGALVGKGEPTLLATIEQIDPIYVNFTQPGADMLRLKQSIRTGNLKRAESVNVELVFEDGRVYPLKGKIFFTDMAVDPATGSVSLRAEFANPEHELLPGMFARVRFTEAIQDNVILVPQRAVQAGAQGQFVMVVGEEGKVAPAPVITGGMTGSDFIISTGLKGGEQVIVNGLQKARPGTVVKPVQWNPSAPLLALPAAKPSEASVNAQAKK